MNSNLEKRRSEEKALDVERRLMKEALAMLGHVEGRPKRPRLRGRLIFGLDLTGSREASLGHARIATAAMFDTIKAIGTVAVKLVYFRGLGECRESKWYDDPNIIGRSLAKLSCEAGKTQIARLLRVVLTEREKLSGVVFVGDHCEDNPDELIGLAQALRAKSIPVFVFHECSDQDERSLLAKPIFAQLAKWSGGIYLEFKPDSGAVLREVLSSVAAFSVGGAEAVRRVALPKTPEARQFQGRLLLSSEGDPKLLR